MEKYCPKCKQKKDTSFFRPNKSRKDGLQPCCIDCDKEYQRQWYQSNKEKIKAKSLVSNKVNRERVQEILLRELEGKKCEHCGEGDILVLEFDHLRDKQFTIGNTQWESEDKIIEEVGKCQVLCANCHRRKTHEDMNTYKWRYSQGVRQESAKL